MNFRFNFSGSTDGSNIQESKIVERSSNVDGNVSSVPCEYIELCNLKSEVVLNNVETFNCAGLTIKYVQKNTVETKMGNLSLIKENKSDLLPGKYEGGLKVWECSFDLARFLAEQKSIKQDDKILELGCGVGLPGIVAYLCGGIVTFQDFNAEVLELVTIPNVRLNTTEEQQSQVSEKCQFLSGDWNCIKEKFYDSRNDKKMYDFIITSETIYEKRNTQKLLDLMKSALKPGGIVYLASKVYYFGVGGGVYDFEELLKKDDTFEYSTVFKISEG